MCLPVNVLCWVMGGIMGGFIGESGGGGEGSPARTLGETKT